MQEFARNDVLFDPSKIWYANFFAVYVLCFRNDENLYRFNNNYNFKNKRFTGNSIFDWIY